MKYVDTKIVFRELPDEITLAINISGCPCHCPGCHSSYLSEDIGTPLNPQTLQQLIQDKSGITAICLMGGDAYPFEIAGIAQWIKQHTDLHVGWYSGRQELPPDISLSLEYFNYIKLGPYVESLGPLDNPNTNQRLYEVQLSRDVDEFGNPIFALNDITFLLWKNSIS
jgi:anaerobic ribonucleoside-triphosphate reductase activating protein